MPTVLGRSRDLVAASGPGSSSSDRARSKPWSQLAAAARAPDPNDSGRDDASPSTMHEYQPLFDALTHAIQRRWTLERELAQRFPAGVDQQEQQLQAALRDLSDRREQQLETLREEFSHRREEAAERTNSNLQLVDYAHREALRQIERAHNDEATALETRYEESAWVTSSVLDDASEDSPKRRFEKFHTQLQKTREEQQAHYGELEVAFQTVREITGWEGAPPLEPENPPQDRETAQLRFQASIDQARQRLADVEGQWLPQLFVGWRALMFFVVLAGLTFLPLFLAISPAMLGLRFEPWSEGWAGMSAGGACGVALLIELIVYSVSSMRQSEALQQVQQSVAEAGWAHQLWLGLAREELQIKTREFEARQREVVRQREASLQRFQAAHANQRQEIETRRETAVQQEMVRVAEQRRQIETRQREEDQALDREERERLTALSREFESEHRRLELELGGHTSTRQRALAQLWHTLRTEWEASLEEFRSSVIAVQEAVREVFPDWNSLLTQWQPPTEIPTALRLGTYQVDLQKISAAMPADPRIAPPETAFDLPALVRFPADATVLLKYKGAAGRAAALQLQQTLLLRLLTLVPPGKLRLTILDPVGLGESFAGFMHLADFDERLVTSRIWTESSQIEARLADLTEHMENVFQKYLRNEFATLEDYNAHAGEVAEPYHFLVISDFPSKFSDVAARRLASILTSGPRCGVYTLLSTDLSQPMPSSFNLRDAEDQVRTWIWREGAYRLSGGDAPPTAPRTGASPAVSDELWSGFEPEAEEPGPVRLSDWPLVIDPPPPPELFTALVKMVGRESKDARRVEVAFSRIAPRADQWWTQDSRREIDVPLGRAGATRLQHLLLGRGTSQHMLVAGKTGSGKSTFLHTLITNVALHYSPEEVRFYLVDFKKGVEFKDYAACEFPHADVIAIESDREFGVSVLQRLDAVLQERGELFRRHGVQDIAGYRNAHPETPLPRILLVVDEFQEFFIEDDKLSQTASLLLDRLVRQGRAFGMHVILGSQTLGGAYSLARSTLGQVAVRVALQCSEADAHLILSESNTAARLLTRPGEAIYNDANGLLEGNHPFQIAWLPDGERETCLRRLADLARARGLATVPPIVFEGNVASDPARNPDLVALLSGAYEMQRGAADAAVKIEMSRTPTVWLGDAVEIGAPASIAFPRQAGQNLLLVGADSEAAYGVLATAVVSLAGQVAGRGAAATLPGVYLLDGSAPDSIESEGWRQLCEVAPAPVRRVLPRDAAAALKELTAELQRREQERDAPPTPLFVIVHHLARFRDLRKAEEDYGFGGFGSQPAEKPVEPGKLFVDLISRGPDVGIHLLVWCDSAGNVERWMSRGTVGEFELRIAFQMNAADSSNLIDTPAAAKLGVHRALLYREESGTSEKFRPYGAPSMAWLQELKTPTQRLGAQPSAGPSGSEGPTVPDEPEVATDLDAFTVL